MPTRDLWHELSQASNLEDELQLIAEASTRWNRRNTEIVLSRWGWSGTNKQTLEQIGQRLGLTRERVRQIEASARKRIASQLEPGPFLYKASRLIGEAAPASQGYLSGLLRERGICPTDFPLMAIDSALNIFTQIERTWTVAKFEGISYAVPVGASQVPGEVSRIANKAVRHYGPVNIDDLGAQIWEVTGCRFGAQQLKAWLRERHDFVWLYKESGWFWLKDAGHSSPAFALSKVLSLRSPIHIGELRSALIRHLGKRGLDFYAPRSVVLAFCEQHSDFITHGEYVSLAPQLKNTDFLEGAERVMADILEANDGVLDGKTFEQLASEAGVNTSTFYVYLGYAPFIMRVSPGVYALRGTSISPSQLEEVQPKSQESKKRMLDFGWTENATIWVAYVLSRNLLHSGVVSVPSGVAQFVPTEMTIISQDGTQFGAAGFNGVSLWGLAKFFRRRGGDEGDILVIEVNPQESKVTIRVGSPELLDEYRA